MSAHGGMLGAISEAAEICRQEGVPIDVAFAMQERRAKKRVMAYRRERPAARAASSLETIPLIMEAQNCDRETALGFWRISQDMKAEASSRRSADVIHLFPRPRQ
jgi:hypothetical protein